MLVYVSDETKKRWEEEARKNISEELKIAAPEDIEYVNKYGVDTKYNKKEFDALVIKMRTGSEKEKKEAKEQIANYTRGYIIKLAHQYCPLFCEDDSVFENLVQAGYLGLYTGLQSYKPNYLSKRYLTDFEHGYMSYLKTYITKEMRLFLSQELNKQSPYTYENIRSIKFAKQALEENGDLVDVRNLSIQARLSEETVENTLEFVRNSNTVSIDQALEEHNVDLGVDRSEVERDAILSELSDALKDAFEVLNSEELFVITSLFGINREEMSLDELSEVTGCTKPHLKYIRGRALNKLSQNKVLESIFAA